MGILKFVIRRLLFGVLTLFIVSIVVFVLTQALSDPARAILGRDALPEALAAKQQELGLDRPMITQYWDWISGLLTGDPGVSFTNGVPVMDVLGDRIWNSLFLLVVSAAISIPLSIAVGAYSALRRDKAFDSTSVGDDSRARLDAGLRPRIAAGRAAGHQRVARVPGRDAHPPGRRHRGRTSTGWCCPC